MRLQDVLIRMGGAISAEGLKLLEEEMKRISSSSDTPWKKVVLEVFADFIEVHGEQGILLARAWIEDLWQEKLDLSPLTLRTASQVLADAQIRERQNKHAVQQFTIQIALQLIPLVSLLL